MASEYQKWIARDVKPVEKRELTPSEKRQNWLDYHKWSIFWIAVAAVCAISFAASIRTAQRTAADVTVAYIGSKALPDDTVKALENAFASFGEDRSGDGKVKCTVTQYVIGEDVLTLPQLAVDLTSGESRIYIMEDPKKIQDTYKPLGYADGVFGDGTVRDEPLWYLWSDCPALTQLELGTYNIEHSGIGLDAPGQPQSNQELLAGLYIGRRGIDASYEYAEADNLVWGKLIAGAGIGE